MKRLARLFFGSLILGFGAYMCLCLAWGVVHGNYNPEHSRFGGFVDLVAGTAFTMAGVLILVGKCRH